MLKVISLPDSGSLPRSLSFDRSGLMEMLARFMFGPAGGRIPIVKILQSFGRCREALPWELRTVESDLMLFSCVSRVTGLSITGITIRKKKNTITGMDMVSTAIRIGDRRHTNPYPIIPFQSSDLSMDDRHDVPDVVNS